MVLVTSALMVSKVFSVNVLRGRKEHLQSVCNHRDKHRKLSLVNRDARLNEFLKGAKMRDKNATI